MTARIVAVRLNPLVTLQDAGRRGAMRYGVSPSGPMDAAGFALATRLVGTTVAFEVGIAGAAFRAEGTVRVALAGPSFMARVDERRVAAPVRLTLRDGETLEVVPGPRGMWAYFAAEGLDPGEPVLGSFATNARTGLGRRDLAKAFRCADAVPGPLEQFADVSFDGPIGLLPGPQHHLFDPAALTHAVIGHEVDRMGYRLDGVRLAAPTHDIVSDGVVAGAIQVPGDGRPIVLMADSAPTGGYPKIAVVARADLWRLAQHRPGEPVQFVWMDLEEAARRRRRLAQLVTSPSPRIVAAAEDSLARENLVDGVWDAAAP